jgi:hypothetical protein
MCGIINNQRKIGNLSGGDGKHDFQPSTLGAATLARHMDFAENR